MTKTWLVGFFMVLLCGYASSVFASSCAPFDDRIIGVCGEAGCKDIFYVKEVSGFLRCSRRPVVEPPPEWASEVLSFRYQEQAEHGKEAVYELTLQGLGYSRRYAFDDFEGYVSLYESEKATKFVYGKFNRLEETAVDRVEQDWHRKAWWASVLYKLSGLINWASLILALLLLFTIVNWYVKWLYGQKSGWWLVLGVLIQGVILFPLVFILVWQTLPVQLASILVPGFWLFQLALVFNKGLCEKMLVQNNNHSDSKRYSE